MSNYYNRQWRLPNNENKDKQSNYSMYIDVGGASSHIDTNYYLPSGTNPKSISFWLKNVHPSGWITNGYQYTVHGGALNVGQGFGIGIIGSSSGAYIWFIGHSTGDYFIPSSATGTMTTNVWYHIVVTYDNTRTNNLHFYLDGVKIDEANETLNTSSANSVKIGANATGGGGSGSQYVYVDGVCFFDYALSASQITTLYGSSSTGIGNPMSISPKPVAYYPLGDKSVFNGANYLVPNIAAVEDDNDITTSYSPYALDFDGANDYINCGNDSSLNFNSSFSVSVWIKGWSGTTDKTVVSKSDGSTFGWSLHAPMAPTYANKFIFWLNTNVNWYNVTNSNNYSDNTKWVNLIAVFNNSTNSLILYSNNVSSTTTTTSGSPTIGNTKNFLIGTGGGGSNRYYTGSISNLSVWNTALTSSQVTEIYNEGVPSNLNNHSAYSNLVSWWQLGSNSSFNTNWTVLDEKGSNNGTSVNMTEDDIVDGVGSSANGLSSGMGGDEVIGDAPYSTANALSVNMDVEDKVSDTPS
tara:strand:- start:697 stop:2265 length:1569 start_codon:yes stop_codon:yes gene_type:complete